MSNFNTSREPMRIDEFIALAEANGWALDTTNPDQPRDEVNMEDAAGRLIVAYPQPTRFSNHTGFKGSSYGLVEVWEEGSLEQAILEGLDFDDAVDGTEVLKALAEVLSYYVVRDPDVSGETKGFAITDRSRFFAVPAHIGE